MNERVTHDNEVTRSQSKSDFNENSLPAQRKRLLDYLKAHGSITTIGARKELDIMCPAARIFELKAQGHIIHTDRVCEPTDYGRLHRIGKYILQPGGQNEIG